MFNKKCLNLLHFPENVQNNSLRYLQSHVCPLPNISLEKKLYRELMIIFCSQGEPQTFDVKFKRAEDYPIDLYYLMDLSFSMKDDLENVKNLGTDLMREMQEITTDFRIGE